MINTIETGSNPNNKKQAVFVSIYTETPIWRNYHEISEENRTTIVPLVLMLQRWDGKIGFIGGNVDGDESLKEAVIREVKEEAGFDVPAMLLTQMSLICSHETNKNVTHLMGLKVSEEIFRSILVNNHKAEHFLSEGTLFSVQMINYPHKPSFDNFMQNNFAPTVKEEIYEFVKELDWLSKYNLNISDPLIHQETKRKTIIKK